MADMEYNFGNQIVTFGSMWAWQVTGYPSWMYPYPAGYNINPYINGIPFNIIKFLQEQTGSIPTTSTNYYFNDDGSTEDPDEATFHISVYYRDGGAHFCATLGVHDPHSMSTLARNYANYYGAQDINNFTELDLNMANVWLYENNVPDDFTVNGDYPGPQRVPNDSFRLLMLYWAVDVEEAAPSIEFMTDTGEIYADHHIPSYTEHSGVAGGYKPVYYVGWSSKADVHLPSFMFNAIETWEDVPQETGGGGGSWGFVGENDGIDELTILPFADLGFTSIYSPDASQIKQLSAILWDDTFLDAMEKSAVGNPMDAIINLAWVPLNTASICGAAENVAIGKYKTGVFMPPLTQASIRIDFGSINVAEKWGSANDYKGSVDIFLPFIGWVQTNISEAMGGTLHLFYDVNLLSGDFVAKLEIVNTWMRVYRRTVTLYQHNGNLQCNIPVTGINYSDYYKNRVGGAAQIIGAVASGISGGMAGMAAGPIGGALGAAVGAAGAISGAVGGVNQMLTPPTIARSGNLTGAGAAMSLKVAKIVIRRPNQYMPDPGGTYGPYIGMPAYVSRKMTDLNGFNVIDADKLDGFQGTSEEMAEFSALCKGGIYL